MFCSSAFAAESSVLVSVAESPPLPLSQPSGLQGMLRGSCSNSMPWMHLILATAIVVVKHWCDHISDRSGIQESRHVHDRHEGARPRRHDILEDAAQLNAELGTQHAGHAGASVDSASRSSCSMARGTSEMVTDDASARRIVQLTKCLRVSSTNGAAALVDPASAMSLLNAAGLCRGEPIPSGRARCRRSGAAHRSGCSTASSPDRWA